MRDVDIPEELIRAHRAGDLVLFVGAGASVDPPSSLPTFVPLTERIAKESGRELTPLDRARPDRFLGELEHDHVDVHARVADLLRQPASSPNALHRGLAELALAGGQVRVVTTNYDLHLTAELESTSNVARYTAPALPVGDDFTGLIHLHGALDRGPASLVVTDRDFGRAYLTDAWAARFLERMFSRFVVLFVGYSHEDVVMSYLARGLGPASRRYALTADPASADWRRLGIEPIGYPLSDDGGHEALGRAISAWAARASMGLLDQRGLIADLVSGVPSEVPEDVSYLEAVLDDPETVRFFTEFADGVTWLTWASTRPTFRALFDPAASSTTVSSQLASWFVHRFVMIEDRSSAALDLVSAHGGRMSAELWHAIGWSLHAGTDPRPAWLNPWLTMLLRDPPEHTSEWLDYALVACQWPDDKAVALALFDHLTEPRLSVRGTFGPLSVRMSIAIAGSEHWLRDAWERVLLPQLQDIADEIVSIGDHHLRRANQLLRAAGVASDDWDPISYRRRGIEPNSEDAYPDAIDVLIDAARDAVVHLARGHPDAADAWLGRWQTSSVPLLRRLVTHVWAIREDKSCDEKLAWLRSHRLLYCVEQHHDVYQLLKSVAGASDGAIAQLVDDVLTGPPDPGEYRDHAIVNLLAWLAQHTPENQRLHAALEEFRVSHPGVEPRTHLDYLSWTESGSIGHQPPMAVEALHDRLGAEPDALVAELVGYSNQTSPFDGPTWGDVTTLVSTAARQSPTDGMALAQCAAEHPEQEHDLLRAIIEGWAGADLTENEARSILQHLNSRDDLYQLRDEVAEMLGDRRASRNTPTRWPTMPEARELAKTLWSFAEIEPDPENSTDQLSRLVWHWGSHLAEFWIQAVAADWRDDRDNWIGLTPALREPLDRIIDADTDPGVTGRATLATRLHFFFGADRDWTDARLLPLFDWSSPEKSTPVWAAFIAWGRWNDAVLNAGLLGHYLGAGHHRAAFEEQIAERLLDHLAGIALHSDLDLVTSNWLARLTGALDDDGRAALWRHVSWQLRELSTETAERRWDEWMEAYWTSRLKSIPVMLSKSEASAMAGWVPHLGAGALAAMRLSLRHEAACEQHSNLLHDLAESELLTAKSVEATEFLAHVLRGTDTPFYGCRDLTKIINRLRSAAGAQPLAVIEQAIRLGCVPSAWEEIASA